MQMTLEIPEDIARSLPGAGRGWDVASQAVLECFAVEAYRRALLSAKQVGELLKHSSRWETEDFLAAHGAWPGITVEDAIADARTLNKLLGE
jgi:hypothetical protein